MRCPNGDAELDKHTHTNHSGLSITHYRCPRCGAFWLDSFSANYIERHEIRRQRKAAAKGKIPTLPSCPVCARALLLARGDSIPPHVAAWQCPDHHGYYFADGELIKFKDAQETKIKYYKIWNIPVSSVTGFLLVGIAVLMITSGIVISSVTLTGTRSATTQAADFIETERAVVNATDRSVLFLVTTKKQASVSLRIKPKYEKGIPLTSLDGVNHYARLPLLLPGTYRYVYVIQEDGKTQTSEEYTLTVP